MTQEGAEQESVSEEQQLTQLAELITQKVGEAVSTKEKEWQGNKDRELQDLQRKVGDERRQKKAAQQALDSAQKRFGDTDPESESVFRDVKRDSELEFYRESRKEDERSEQLRQEAATEQADVVAELQELGVDPNDPRLTEATRGLTEPKAVFRAVRKKGREIARENMKTNLDDIKKEVEASIRKELGLDSHDTGTQSSSGKRWTRKAVGDYDASGKSPQEMAKDMDSVLDQLTNK